MERGLSFEEMKIEEERGFRPVGYLGESAFTRDETKSVDGFTQTLETVFTRRRKWRAEVQEDLFELRDFEEMVGLMFTIFYDNIEKFVDQGIEEPEMFLK